MYDAINAQKLTVADLFYEMEIATFGYVMAFLALVHLNKCSQDEIRRVVRLVSVPLKQCGRAIYKMEDGYFERLWSWISQQFK